MACRLIGTKPLFEPMLEAIIILLTLKYLTRPQWVILGIEALALAEERSFDILFVVRMNRMLKNIRVLINFRRHSTYVMSL